MDIQFKTNSQAITDWLLEVGAGVQDRDKLRTFLTQMYQVWERPLETFERETGTHVVICNVCGLPEFTMNTISAYSNAYSICFDCRSHFSWCQECQTNILTSDLGNPTHTHLKPSNRSPLFLQDQEVDLWNADIIAAGGRTLFLKTASETEVWKHTKEARLNILSPAHSEAKFRYFGIELEVEKISAGPPDMIGRTRHALGKYAMIKHDGSLKNKGRDGFEIVSVPATLAYHKSGVWDFFFKWLGSYFEEAPTTTGLHIHVGMDTISKVAAGKMLVFINALKNREFVESVAERRLGVPSPSNGKIYACVNDKWRVSHMMSLRQHLPECVWSPENRKFINKYTIDSKTGLIKKDVQGNPIIASIKTGAMVVRPICKCPEGKYNTTKYEAFRLATQRPTVEIRIFRGVVRQNFLYGALEFVDALVDFCSETSPSQLSYRDFLVWICRYNQSGQTKLYPNLSRLLINKGWIDPQKEKLKPEIKATSNG